MQKKILITLCGLLLVGCASQNKQDVFVTKQDLLGEWNCTTQYPEMDLVTVDNLTIHQDGSLFNEGVMINHNVFVYGVEQKGTWQLNGNALTYRMPTNKVTRKHSDKVIALLAKDKNLKSAEEKLFKLYSSPPSTPEGELIDLMIIGRGKRPADNREFLLLEQKIDTHRFGNVCYRMD
ncbi:hypothetical protein [Pasteurella bettyae]|uniref:Lipoprotein n=1 Tax=Pasteurella bettyae CCUG 2042 TaxID=1095749 RepID=I3DEJ1_9PAST|nr:hypothetical protein [Pasteurella bettyae]EIJ70134.1 hypothetical protein HMPREF1052_1558 [Pasteurella bettyae CCUG 2042]SUB21953.1 Uncharacterised protein [Pasteurella bettyae]